MMELPILEPLDAATKEALQPVKARKRDSIWVTTTDNGDDFYVIGFTAMTREDWKSLPPSVRRDRLEQIKSDTGHHHKMSDGQMVYRDSVYLSFEVREWFNKIPERKYLGARNPSLENHWVVSGTDVSALLLQHAWSKSQIGFSKSGRVLYEYLLARFYAQNVVASAQAEFKLNGTIPDAPPDWKEKEGLELAGYQRFAMQLSIGRSVALFAEPGTGKTPISIGRINLEAKRARAGKLHNPVTEDYTPHMYRCLVVCPGSVRTNWRKEIVRFSTVPGKITTLKGAPTERLKLLTRGMRTEADCAFSVCIVSIDTAVNDVDSLKMCPWDLLIWDESHMGKSPATRRWKDCMSILRESAMNTMPLTGTPGRLMQLWTQFEFLGRGLSGFTSMKGFRDFHGKYRDHGDGSGGSIQKLVGLKNVALIQERLSRLSFRITKKEAGLNLPDKVYDTWEVEMSTLQRKTYDELSEQLATEIEAGVTSGKMTIDHVLTKLLRLAQVCSGFAKLDDVINSETGEVLRKGNTIALGSPSLKAIASVEMVESKPKEAKSIFWVTHVFDIHALEAALTEAGIGFVSYWGGTSAKDREIAIERFNSDPECRVFISNPKAAGMGVNLLGYDPHSEDDSDTYCDLVCFYSMNWSEYEYLQAQDRAHRRGTKMPVTIRHLIVADTIDEEIRDVVDGKVAEGEVLHDISGMLKRVLNLDIDTAELAHHG